MSLEYDLHVGRGLDERGLLHIIRHLPGFKVAGDLFEGPGVTGIVFAAGDLGIDIIREGLGIEVANCVGFRVDLSAYTEGEGHIGIGTICRTSLRIIGQGRFDAALVFNGDTPVLLRRGGALRLKKTGFWQAFERLSLVTVPYVLEELPVL